MLTPGQQAIGAALVMTSAFTPMVFMGEEWAASTPWQYFTDFTDPDLARAVREGRRREFAEHGWDAEAVPDPQDPATREASVLRWDERRHGDHARMLAWYHDLIALRRKEKVLTNGVLGDVEVDVDEDAEWLVVRRGDLRVVANFAEQPQSVPVDAEPIDVVLAWDPAATSLHDAGVDLGAHGVAVVRVSG